MYSWEADKNAGLDIIASRMDTDTDDITTNGLSTVLTRDGQGFATANLPMGGYKHTGVGTATARTDYADTASVQDGILYYAIAGGTADALTAVFTPVVPALVDGQQHNIKAAFKNATTTPTYVPSGLAAKVITKLGGQALSIGDIYGAGHELILRYAAATTSWELLNPGTAAMQNVGTWTPFDDSGAGLTFVSVSANYTKIGNIVFAYAQLNYPITADATTIAIGGLPFAIANAIYAKVPFAIMSTANLAFTIVGVPAQGQMYFNILNSETEATITNANLSNSNIAFLAIYPVT